jgi:hypothetical protein
MDVLPTWVQRLEQIVGPGAACAILVELDRDLEREHQALVTAASADQSSRCRKAVHALVGVLATFGIDELASSGRQLLESEEPPPDGPAQFASRVDAFRGTLHAIAQQYNQRHR